MAALDYLCRAGLVAEINGDGLRLRPVERITDAVRQFVRDHRAQLLAELIAANDAQPLQATAAAPAPAPAPAAERPAEARRNAWTITRGGNKPVCTICGAPMTRDEALAEARWRWPDADIE
ncbi:hypothetical protein HA520_05970 [Azotobacter chroococcum]|uniref:TubC N-terminal docking domain-containing protein n=1 Tax=Azotobacter chroococcum TaxID=353 RepID=A0AA44C5R4_9GAMM|nr:hypothetical protein [Azotobacter chroococcum]NHN76834.1 hypothetical protein [Azotobacter chroococcum]